MTLKTLRRVGICTFLGALMLTAVPSHSQDLTDAILNGIKWRSIGPYRGGRVLAVAGLPGSPLTYYFGAAAGGVWKTTNGGLSWRPIFDHEAVSSIGSIAVAPSDSNVIYVGTGESCIRNEISYGNGVYKSVDGGQTWKNIGLQDSRHIGAIIVNPRDPDVVLVAALGHAYGPNADRGIFRTLDGGKTWQKVLYKDEKTGGIDVVFDPRNPNIVFAALWQAQRTPWSLSSGGPGSGIYKSIDGGSTWKHLVGNGLPDGALGRIGIAVAATSNRVYALVEAKDGGLYRSDDAGNTWKKINGEHRLWQRGFYFTHVFADPKQEDTLYILNYAMFRSRDGGVTFSVLPAPHGDHHGLWIDPTDPDRMIEGNDGGATISVNGGASWSTQDNQPTAQFYHVIADNRFPYCVYGAQQDNSTIAIATKSDTGAIDRSDWYPVGGGESGYIAPDPSDPNIVYASSYQGVVTRFDKRTGQEEVVSPWPEFDDGFYASQVKYRFNWTTPVAISIHDPKTLYVAGNRLFRSTDRGMSWEAISPDLTRNDKSKQGPSGGPISNDNAGTEYYDTIYALAESPVDRGVMWVGSDDGLLHLTRNAGENWVNVTPPGLPEFSKISIVEASPFDAATAYIAVDRHQLDDFRPYIFTTTDFGKTWREIGQRILEGAYVHAIREDPKRRGLLYAGTEVGLFISFNNGAKWQRLRMNLPTTPIYDLIVKDNDLVVATHGRSFWILDDLAPLRQLDSQVLDSPVHLFHPEAAYRFHMPEFLSDAANSGKNPPAGAVIDYYFKVKPKDEVTLEIFDPQGRRVRKLSSRFEQPQLAAPPESPHEPKNTSRLPAEAGLNRFVWDLAYEPPVEVPGLVYAEGVRLSGPQVVPATYRVKLTVGKNSLTTGLEIRPDPRINASPQDLDKQLELGLKIRDDVTKAHDTVNRIRDLRVQLQHLRKAFGNQANTKSLLMSSTELERNMSQVEETLVQVKKTAAKDSFNYGGRLNDQIIMLESTIENADAAPTQQDYQLFEALDGKLQEQLTHWNNILRNELPHMNETIREANVPYLVVAAPATN